MHTGSIIDFYDDPQGTVLREKVAHAALPSYVKEAHFYDDAARGSLPDDAFALVALDGNQKFRKFACADPGNTALSVIYFMENHHKLPEEAQKVAAANLCEACAAYGIQPPLALRKTAGLGGMLNAGMGAMAVKGQVGAGIARHKQAMGKVGDLTGTEVMPFQSSADGTTKQAGLASGWKQGREASEMSRAFLKQIPKLERAGMVLGAIGPKRLAAAGGAAAAAGTGLYALGRHHGKKKEAQLYVDITGQTAPPQFEKRAHQRFCLEKQGQGRFPIDDYGQVMDATRWFEDNGHSLHPEDRREYCTKLAHRADEIGISTTDRIRKYAGADYAPDGEIKVGVCTRMQFWADDSPERDMLSGLMDKYASVPPEVFCEALRQFDEATGLDHHWDDAVYDPWYTTYGMQKTAEWVWEHGNDRLTSDQLKKGCCESKKAIAGKFGEEVADALAKKPEAIFDSLPLDHKRIISRIVTDPQ